MNQHTFEKNLKILKFTILSILVLLLFLFLNISRLVRKVKKKYITQFCKQGSVLPFYIKTKQQKISKIGQFFSLFKFFFIKINRTKKVFYNKIQKKHPYCLKTNNNNNRNIYFLTTVESITERIDEEDNFLFNKRFK